MKRSCRMAKTKDALKILDPMIGDDADMRQMIAEETLKAELARMIYGARTTGGDRCKSKNPNTLLYLRL
jgi:hypothetical protein